MGNVFNFFFQTIYWIFYFGYDFSFPGTFSFFFILFYSFLLLFFFIFNIFIFEDTVGFLNVFLSSISAFPWGSFFLISWLLSFMLATCFQSGYPWMSAPIGLGPQSRLEPLCVCHCQFSPEPVIFSKEQFFHLLPMCSLSACNNHPPLGLAWPSNFLSEQRPFGE